MSRWTGAWSVSHSQREWSEPLGTRSVPRILLTPHFLTPRRSLLQQLSEQYRRDDHGLTQVLDQSEAELCSAACSTRLPINLTPLPRTEVEQQAG